MQDEQSSSEEGCPYCPAEQHLQIIRNQLYGIYSSSQNYYYTKEINEIIEEALTTANVRFEDLQYFDDFEEFLKRQYQMSEFRTKMFNINQYYYYHRDAPRLYLSGIAKPYNRWQDRRKSFLYRKLKRMLNEPQSQSQTNHEYSGHQEVVAPSSKLLMDISDYNPYSKKYYLRKKTVKEALPTETTKNMYQELNNLLKSFGDLSQLTISSERAQSPKVPSPMKTTTRLEEPYRSLKDSQTITKFNFKKKKITIEPAPPITERQGRSTILQRHSSERKPSLLTFRRSEQQIVINHTPQDTRRSIPTISVSTKKQEPKENLQSKRSQSLRNVRVRVHQNLPDTNASRLKLKKSEPAKRRQRNDSTKEFCDDKLVRPRVESYQSQQMQPVKPNKQQLLAPAMSTALTTLETTQRWNAQRKRPSINDETINRILRQRFDGK